jgi:N-acetylglutamate synthase-like GNAT family acetyltransferase
MSWQQEIRSLLRLNKLETEPTQDFLSRKATEIVLIIREGAVVACARIRKVQWYQGEISYLCVSPNWRNTRVALELKSTIEERMRSLNLRIWQCTTRKDNEQINRYLSRRGWKVVNTFTNNRHTVQVWQIKG